MSLIGRSTQTANQEGPSADASAGGRPAVNLQPSAWAKFWFYPSRRASARPSDSSVATCLRKNSALQAKARAADPPVGRKHAHLSPVPSTRTTLSTHFALTACRWNGRMAFLVGTGASIYWYSALLIPGSSGPTLSGGIPMQRVPFWAGLPKVDVSIASWSVWSYVRYSAGPSLPIGIGMWHNARQRRLALKVRRAAASGAAIAAVGGVVKTFRPLTFEGSREWNHE